jgi:magnesium-transporting ATPase (P-type)
MNALMPNSVEHRHVPRRFRLRSVTSKMHLGLVPRSAEGAWRLRAVAHTGPARTCVWPQFIRAAACGNKNQEQSGVMKSNAATPHAIEKPHALPGDEVLRKLDSSPEGLSADEAAKRLESVGPNRLPEPPKEGLLKRFFKHFHDLLIYILIAAAGVTAALGHWVDTGVILGVVIINAIIGFIQEGKAEQALAGIRKMLSAHAQARRGGDWAEIEADDLVPGDIVRLRSGDRVPADLRLIEAVNLRLEESALTGESVPAEKKTDPADTDAGVGDRHGMAYSGTMVAAGRGTGVVTATGPATELGRINQMISEVETLATPLTRQMNRFGKILSIVIVGLAVLMWFAGWLLHDFTTSELFLAAIGFAVAAIPEGLPAILTITLALGVQRMARRKAITRKLNAVETLGSVTVVCSDKTGTLTRNEMTARDVVTPRGPLRGVRHGLPTGGRDHARERTGVARTTPRPARVDRGHGRVQRFGDRGGRRPLESHR